MSRTPWCVILAVVMILTGVAPAARAVIIEATLTGEVDYLDAALQAVGAPFDQIALGDPFLLKYVFESETPNLLPGGSLGDATGRYEILSLETTVGPFHSTATPISVAQGGIVVLNSTTGADRYTVGAELPDKLVAFDLAASARLEDSSATAFSSVMLPLSLDPAAFDSTLLRLGQAGSFLPPASPRVFVEGSITGFTSRVAPEPAAWLLAVAAAGCFFSRLRIAGRPNRKTA